MSGRPPNVLVATCCGNTYHRKCIQHKLSHINISSRFWLTQNKINLDEGIYVSSFEEYPMSKLMHKFIEKYTHELSLF